MSPGHPTKSSVDSVEISWQPHGMSRQEAAGAEQNLFDSQQSQGPRYLSTSRLAKLTQPMQEYAGTFPRTSNTAEETHHNEKMKRARKMMKQCTIVELRRGE